MSINGIGRAAVTVTLALACVALMVIELPGSGRSENPFIEIEREMRAARFERCMRSACGENSGWRLTNKGPQCTTKHGKPQAFINHCEQP